MSILSLRFRLLTDVPSPPRARKRQPRPQSGHVWPGPGQRRLGSAAAVEAELDDAGGDEAGALATGVAGDVELGGESLKPPLGRALADVELGGDLGPGGRAA